MHHFASIYFPMPIPRKYPKMPWRGFEPPRGYPHMVLSHARLPVPPPGQSAKTYSVLAQIGHAILGRASSIADKSSSRRCGTHCDFCYRNQQSQIANVFYTGNAETGSQPDCQRGLWPDPGVLSACYPASRFSETVNFSSESIHVGSGSPKTT